MKKTKQAKYPTHICVRCDDEGELLIVGSPDDPSRMDADDGDRLATYTLNGPIRTFRQHPRLEIKR